MSDGKETWKQMQSEIKEFFSTEITEEQLNSFTKQECMNYYEDLKQYRDLKNSLDYAEEKGKKRGVEMGMEMGKKEVAKKLLLEGLSIELVAKTTDLTIEQIQQLKDNLDE